MPHIFDEDGLEDLMVDLYALTDADLLLEAKVVSTDFSGWLKDNFTLTADQNAYLGTASGSVLFLWGNLFAAAMVSRGTIWMPTPISNPAPRRTKELRQNINGSLKYDDSSKVITGNINISMDWALL